LTFFGRFTLSKGGEFNAAFSDGRRVVEKGVERLVTGKVLLLRGDDLIWAQEVARPWVAKVADNGTVIAIDSGHKSAQTLGGTLLVFDSQGQTILKREFDSNLNDCSITGDARICFVNTLAPDNSLYSFEVHSGELLWKLKDKEASTGLIGIDDEKAMVEIRNRQQLGVQRVLDFTGKPVPGQVEDALTKIRTIASDAESSVTISVLLGSDNSPTVLKTLERLKALLSLKGVSLQAESFIPALRSLYRSNVEKISQLAFDNLLLLHERHLGAHESTFQFLVESLASDPMDTNSLFQLTKLARVDAGSLCSLIPRVLESLVSSPEWNERRFAAFVMGEVGKQRPDLVKDCVPHLVHYVSHPEETKEKPLEVHVRGLRISMSPAGMLGVDPGVWLKDASIDALGSIGSADPRLVSESLPILQRIASSDKSIFSKKKAERALQSIHKATAKAPDSLPKWCNGCVLASPGGLCGLLGREPVQELLILRNVVCIFSFDYSLVLCQS